MLNMIPFKTAFLVLPWVLVILVQPVSEWLIAAGLEIGSEFVLFADIHMEPGGFEKQFIATGFRLPLSR